jgi:alpha-L-rhamnosidase
MNHDILRNLSRRSFLQTTTVAGAMPASSAAPPAAVPQAEPDLALAARWIWYPERRTLPCTFVFFRRSIELSEAPTEAPAWITAVSRYMLFVNGRLLQRGPAPSDPRTWDVDPIDLRPHLRPGTNVIGVLVCHFGHGDGTSVSAAVPAGEAGFLFQADLKVAGQAVRVASDAEWKSLRARCWPAGKYQRWFLRALQEEFDARLYPYGWNDTGFDDSAWRAAAVQKGLPGRPPISSTPREGWHADWKLTPRAIPPMLERRVLPTRLAGVGRIDWRTPPEEYFDCFPPDAFRESADASLARASADGALFPLRVQPAGPEASTAVTFEFEREIAGHIFVRLRAPAGTVVEILYVEAQEPGALMLRTAPNFGQWMRLTARDGETTFESFDYDALRSLQLLIRNASGPVEILEAGVTERLYPYPYQPDFQSSDAQLNRVLAGSVNSHLITCQDTMMDNVTRERQQYAGDVDHAKLASYYAFGEYRQPRRMLHTFAQGQNDDGWFLDCYPAWDRCMRLYQKHLHLTIWGPLVDHSMGFLMSVATYHLFSGDTATVRTLYPRLKRFDAWLRAQVRSDGLLPVDGYTWNDVWIDHYGWKSQADKAAALNIYYVGYLREGVARLADLMSDAALAREARRRADAVTALVRERFWSARHKLVVDNLPRLRQDGAMHLHDRTLSMALLYGIVPPGEESEALRILASLPTAESPESFPLPGGGSVGMSFTANACWRYWALCRFGQGAAVIRDLIERWGGMISLRQNQTFSEWWHPKPSSSGQVWAQNTQVPIFVLYGQILGVMPTAPAFRSFDVRPQLGPLGFVEATVFAPSGGIHLRCERRADGVGIDLLVPASLRPALVLPRELRPKNLPTGGRGEPAYGGQCLRWNLPASDEQKRWKLDCVRS